LEAEEQAQTPVIAPQQGGLLPPPASGAAVRFTAVAPKPRLGQATELQHTLLAWYDWHKRDLPWRHSPDPYAVLVSEFMLQQTQADRVAPRFLAFLEQFPTLEALATASTAAVLRAWSGLGYNVRALRLQAIAREAVRSYAGRLPAEIDELMRLPGVGRYTAAAIAAFAYGRQAATVDTNIRRVLRRLFVGVDAVAAAFGDAKARQLAADVLPLGRAADWNQALMDVGATICTARQPACPYCPLEALCQARHDQLSGGTPIDTPASAKPGVVSGRQPERFAGSSRYYRGRIVRALTQLEPGHGVPLARLGQQIKEDFAGYETTWLAGVVEGLARDGLVSVQEADGEVTVSLPEAGVSDVSPDPNPA